MGRYILTEIWIYPVKGLGGIRVPSARVMEKGLEFDRRWMLIDEAGMFMTQRMMPPMALFKPAFAHNSFVITLGDDAIALPFGSYIKGQAIQAVIWDDTVTVFEVSEKISAWFSDKLDMKCRLVTFPEENSRPVDPDYRLNDENVSLADGFPFLIIGQTSLDELNERLERPVPMNRFRPNLVFTGGEGHEEDEWKIFTIGKNKFAGVKPCARCPVPTIDQDTAVRGKEPIATLAKYRNRNNKVYFGQNVIAIDHNEIREGDEITF
jgi:uncharacterized protein YcbX